MRHAAREHRLRDAWWTLILFAAIGVFLFVTGASFSGTFRSYVPVTLTSNRSGLVMDAGAKVMMRGVQVGRVAHIDGGKGRVNLRLEIEPDQIRYIPANVQAQISATTAFGAKFVELVYPESPSRARLAAGAVLNSKNVSTEINTVFENVVDLLNMIDPLKLNAVLTAVADGVRGQGRRIGEATTDLNQVLQALNARSDTIRRDWRSLKNFADTYDTAARDILSILNATSTTSTTVVNHSSALDALLLNAIGISQAGTNLLGTSRDNLVASVNTLEPTTNLLLKYNPEYTCFLQGAKWYLDNGGYSAWGGADRRTLQLDVALLLGNDPYVYPDNLPIVGAKGGPGGKPGCGSLPDATKNFPVRQLITDTGWGTGLDIRPNPGIGHPCWAQWFQVTRATPQPPSVRQCIPGPAVGPDPGGPPYGAALYGPGGVPCGRESRRPRPRRGRRPRIRGRRRGDRQFRRATGRVGMRETLRGVIFRLGIFLTVCLLTAFLLFAVFAQLRFGGGNSYFAEFTNVSGLREGKLVRIAGVEVGKVKKISINRDATVRVEFTADDSVTLTEGSQAVIRYDNLFGDRYLALEEGAGGLKVLKPGQTIPVARTKPALDLDALIGGFKPLFRALNPEQVNALSEQLLQAFQGQGATIGSFLDQAAAVTNTLADRDQLIGEVVNNLNVVLGSLGGQSDRLDKAVTSLSELVHGLAQRKSDISNAVAYTNAATRSVADLLSQARAPFAEVVHQTDRVASVALADHDYLDNLLNTLPDKYQALVRQGMYGDFFAFYFCDVVLKLNGKGGQPVYVKVAGQATGRCAPK